jgi:hypothetical protein
MSYHINGAGNPGLCSATVKPCPFGVPAEHYRTPEAARRAYEAKQQVAAPLRRDSAVTVTVATISTPGDSDELRLIDQQLLAQALRIAEADSHEERQLLEAETAPIAIIRAERTEVLIFGDEPPD